MLFCVALFLLPAVFALPPHGGDTQSEEFPYLVAINVTKSNGRNGVCGGTLISSSYVLAPAHCVVDTNSASLTIGSEEFPDRQINVVSTEHKVHEGYEIKHQKNDIAIIKLPKPVQLNDHIKTIKITTGGDNFAGKDGAIIAKEKSSGKVKRFPTKVLSNEACEKIPNLGSYILPSHVCVEEISDLDSCRYAGSPLVVDDVQIGLSSFGAGVCSPEYPSVFTRLNSFTDWINKIIGQQ